MVKTDKNNAKIEFKKEFQSGELYNQWQNIYQSDDYLSKVASHRMEIVLKLIDSYKIGQTGMALDIGMGSGVLLEALARRCPVAFGADFSIDMVRGTRARLRGLDGKLRRRLLVGDIESLSIKSNTFDLVTCLGVLEYLPTDHAAMAELYRILRPGGYLLLAVGSYHRIGSLFELVMKKIAKTIFKKTMQTPPVDGNRPLKNWIRTVKPANLCREAIETGFQVRELKCFGGKLFGRYFPMSIYVPKVIYIGDICLVALTKPT